MKILFQGDSITDAGRNTTNGSLISIGQSYAMLVDSRLSVKYPGKFTFENFGISGNRIVDVYARIKRDVWNREPDVLSVLIGINDVWHDVSDSPNGVDAGRFRRVYSMLVEDTLTRFPDMKLLLMEPFVLKAAATENKWDFFREETALRAEAARGIAQAFGQTFLPLQKTFDDALALAPASYWLGDGVHPTPAGHQLIADRWIEVFEREILK